MNMFLQTDKMHTCPTNSTCGASIVLPFTLCGAWQIEAAQIFLNEGEERQGPYSLDTYTLETREERA
jgi:hypothetical protein